jgi:hypothetical protein
LDQVARDEVLVVPAAIDIVRVEAVVSLGVNHEDLGNLLFSDQLVHLLMDMSVAVDRPAGMVVVQSMEKINDGIIAVAFGIGRRQVDGKLPVLL